MTDGVFGIVILTLVVIQAGFGWYHHKRFMRDNPTHCRWFTQIHIWLGRMTILSGMINCGCGLVVAQVQFKWVVAWWIGCSVLSAIYCSTYLIILVLQRRKLKKDLPYPG